MIVHSPRTLALAFLSLLLLTSCAHHQQARVDIPPPPPVAAPPTPANVPSAKSTKPPVEPKTESKKNETAEEPDEEITIPADAKPIETQTGAASWYGPPYHNRVGSNGKVYNMNAMTAAHRTLPMGSIVRVTNLKTGNSAMVRITDRGPFVEGRILDLSLAAAKKIDVWKPGVAEVKVEVMETPTALATGGRWAVQIGSFEDQKSASELADHLARRYQTAKVISFLSPVGAWWVRVRVLNDERQRAEALVHETETPQGAVYLVRLD